MIGIFIIDEKINSDYAKSIKALCKDYLYITFDEAKKFKSIIFDNKILKNHFSFGELIRTADYLVEKQKSKYNKEFEVLLCGTTIVQILHCRKIEELLKIKTLELEKIEYDDYNTEILVNDSILKNYNELFNGHLKTKIETKLDLLKLLYKCYRQLLGDIINKRKCQITINKKKHRYYEYYINMNVVQKHINLFRYRNPNVAKIEKHIAKRFDIKKKEIDFVTDSDSD